MLQASVLLTSGFILLSILLLILFSAVLKSWKVFAFGSLWLVVTALIAQSGFISNFAAIPPRAPIVFVPLFLIVLFIAFSRFGKPLVALPLAFLVAYQAFRIPVELLIHQAVTEDVAPPQLTWSGLNFDILSGISALLLFPLAHRLPRWLILLWNTLALGLLIWVVIVSTLSLPSPVQLIQPDNTWIAYFPFVWLPTVAVACALLGHLIVYRKLLHTP